MITSATLLFILAEIRSTRVVTDMVKAIFMPAWQQTSRPSLAFLSSFGGPLKIPSVAQKGKVASKRRHAQVVALFLKAIDVAKIP